jgi:N,N'-diacetyllegionaminate synthase
MFDIKTWVQKHQRPLFIAEIGVNHNGRVDLAKQLIDAAKTAGADVVKLQSFQVDDLACRSTLSAPHIDASLGFDGDVYGLLKALSLSYDDQRTLKNYADAVGIPLTSTPFGLADVEFLQGLDVPFLKIGSTDVTYHAMLTACARSGLPTVLSTGMATLDEVAEAVNVFQATHNAADLSLLHCVSLYPPKDLDLNLRAITALEQAFPYCVTGYSDHSLNNTAPLAAIALGACIIEKHFTMDRAMAGPDHTVSADPATFKTLVEEGTRLFHMLGVASKFPGLAEQENIPAFRRSLVARQSIPQGTRITADMLMAKRPGTGLSPNMLPNLIGQMAACDIPADTPLMADNAMFSPDLQPA